MTTQKRGLLFRKRNILGVVLIAGIWLGAYLGKWGLGVGDGFGLGKGGSAWVPRDSRNPTSESVDDTPAAKSENDPPTLPSSAKFVKVIIDDHAYLLVNEAIETPISLPNLMDLVKQVPGDEDGIKLRVYEKASARMSSEESLRDALDQEKIPPVAVIWVPAGATK